MSQDRITQAVVIIHGIGEQRPMDTLRSFVDAVLPEEAQKLLGTRNDGAVHAFVERRPGIVVALVRGRQGRPVRARQIGILNVDDEKGGMCFGEVRVVRFRCSVIVNRPVGRLPAHAHVPAAS